MLEIKIDLVPYGQERNRKTIGTIKIVNDGSGDYDLGNYKYTVSDHSAVIKGKLKKHSRSQSVFYLLKKVLNKAFNMPLGPASIEGSKPSSAGIDTSERCTEIYHEKEKKPKVR